MDEKVVVEGRPLLKKAVPDPGGIQAVVLRLQGCHVRSVKQASARRFDRAGPFYGNKAKEEASGEEGTAGIRMRLSWCDWQGTAGSDRGDAG